MTMPRIIQPAEKVQLAHDLLTGILEDPGLRKELLRTRFQWIEAEGALAGLCWLLGHEENPAFAVTLERLEVALQRLGITIVDSG